MTEQQCEMLLGIASEWTGIMYEAVAAEKLDAIKKDLGETWFAWSGPTEKGKAAYFRIQGPTVFIEYAPQRLGGDPTKHLHTIYRDPTPPAPCRPSRRSRSPPPGSRIALMSICKPHSWPLNPMKSSYKSI